MRYLILMRANSPEAVKAALKKGRVPFTIDGEILDTAAKAGAQNPLIAQKIYDTYKSGSTLSEVGGLFSVSPFTVLRVVHSPRKYGVDAEPIRRNE